MKKNSSNDKFKVLIKTKKWIDHSIFCKFLQKNLNISFNDCMKQFENRNFLILKINAQQLEILTKLSKKYKNILSFEVIGNNKEEATKVNSEKENKGNKENNNEKTKNKNKLMFRILLILAASFYFNQFLHEIYTVYFAGTPINTYISAKGYFYLWQSSMFILALAIDLFKSWKEEKENNE